MQGSKKYSFKDSRASINNYFKWRIERVKPAIEKVDKIKKLTSKTIVLDVGCGYGSLASILINKGIKVYGTETDNKKLKIAKQKLNNKNLTLKLVKDEKLPFKNNYFDVVFLFDVIEHVKNPGLMMREVKRVLKKDGLLYVEFTPYYSLAGHHLYDYTLLPIHLYKSKEGIKNIIYSRNINKTFDSDYYFELFLQLNKLKISDFQLLTSGLKKIEESHILKYPDKLKINLSILNILPSPFKDLFTFSFEGLYQK